MVLTRSMYKVCVSIGGSSDTIPKAGDSRHGSHTIVHGDTARVAVDNHASARSRRTKSNSALQPKIYVEDKPVSTRSRAAVPRPDKDKTNGRKPSRGMKPRRGHQATKQSRGPKTSAGIAGLTGDSVADGLHEDGHPRRSGKTGTKRSRGSEEDASDPEAILRANTRHVRRKIHGPAGQAVQCNAIVPGVSPANEYDAGSPCQAPRRSARLASKSSNPIVPQDLCSLAVGAERIVDWCSQTRRKRTRAQECNGNESKQSNVRCIRRRIREAVDQSEVETEGRTSGSDSKTESSEETLVKNGPHPYNVDRPGRKEDGSTPAPSVKVEDIDQDWLLHVDNERHASVETVASVYWKNRESTEPRSSSVESLLTPPPPCMEEEEEVLLHHDFDAMIPLDSLPDEHERNELDRAYLRQQQEHRPYDEAEAEAEMTANRYRSLAPEPDQGLVDVIRSGGISGLASPE
ncbi:hypothetical protein ACEPAI_1680 [Sanghuangporus weigelae]